VSAASQFRYWRLAYLSKPKNERSLYRAMRHSNSRSILEIGVKMAERSKKLIEVAQRFQQDEIQYTGIDLFEGRPQSDPGATLKSTHRTLGQTGAKIKLCPGDPQSALMRISNSLSDIDLVVIAADQDPESLARAWYYVPRMLHAESLVFVQQNDATGNFQRLTALEIQRLADANQPTRTRRAA